MEHLDLIGKFLTGPGVEIGAFKTPIPGIRPTYVDRFREYANEPTNAEFYGDACDLPFRDSSLQFVATSHVIEHVANPLAAFREWYRVLQHRGIIYMVVPDRRFTWDRPRTLTPVDHMVDDFRRSVTQVDGTHIDDFVFGVDWAQFSPGTPADATETERQSLAERYRQAIAEGNEINIHFHTFEPETMGALLARAAETLGVPGRFALEMAIPSFPSSTPNGFLLVARVHKSLGERIGGAWERGFKHPTALRADAKKF